MPDLQVQQMIKAQQDAAAQRERIANENADFYERAYNEKKGILRGLENQAAALSASIAEIQNATVQARSDILRIKTALQSCSSGQGSGSCEALKQEVEGWRSQVQKIKDLMDVLNQM